MALLFLGEFGAGDRGDVVAVSRWVNCEGDAALSNRHRKSVGGGPTTCHQLWNRETDGTVTRGHVLAAPAGPIVELLGERFEVALARRAAGVRFAERAIDARPRPINSQTGTLGEAWSGG